MWIGQSRLEWDKLASSPTKFPTVKRLFRGTAHSERPSGPGLEITTHCATMTYGKGFSEKVRYQGQSGELNKSSEFPRMRFNGEAESKRPRLFSFLSKGFHVSRLGGQQTESALPKPENRISATRPCFFVSNSQILCFTEKSYLTAKTEIQFAFEATKSKCASRITLIKSQPRWLFR